MRWTTYCGVCSACALSPANLAMLPPARPPCPLQVPYYEYALDMILDNEPPPDVMLTDQQHEMLENAAEMLYGLIHARYLVTARGLSAMMEKFKNCDFGRCPRCARLLRTHCAHV